MKYLEVAQTFEKIEQTAGRNDMTQILVETFSKLDFKESQIFTYMLDGRVAPYFIAAEYSFSEKSVLNALVDSAKLLQIDFDINEARSRTGDIGLAVAEYVEKQQAISIKQQASKIKNQTSNLELNTFYDLLWKIVNTTGNGSVQKKTEIFLNAIKLMTPVEAKFFARIVVGKLRLGANVKTVLDAISISVSGSKDLRELLDSAYGFTSDSGYLVAYVGQFKGKTVEEVKEKLQEIKPIPGVPIYPRLVERVESFEEGFKRMSGGEIVGSGELRVEDGEESIKHQTSRIKGENGNGFILQPKYDGMRCQIHIGVDYSRQEFSDHIWSSRLSKTEKITEEVDMFSTFEPELNDENSNNDSNHSSDKIVKLFTRNLEDLTEMFPEIVEYAKTLDCDTAILDSEVVGIDYKKKAFIPFQDTMTRRRKYGVEGKSEDLPVKTFVFDVIEVNGVDLTRENLAARAKAVASVIEKQSEKDLSEQELFAYITESSDRDFFDKDKLVVFAPFNYVTTSVEQRELFDKYVKIGFEGVVVKSIAAYYLPGVRNFEWIKLKKTMDQGHVDSFDLVVLGYYFGSGKQVEFGMGALLAGVYNRSTGFYEPVTKIGTGITQEQWREIKTALDEITLRYEELVTSEKFGGAKVSKSVTFANYEVPDKWVYPKIVVSVDADEISRSQSYEAGKSELGFGLALRFPRLIEWGRDKLAEDATSVDELVEMYRMRKS